MDRLKDEVAFITGSGSGIGRAAAVLFARESVRVAVADISRAGGGSVINTTSVVALRGSAGRDAYTAAKGGVVSLTRSLAVEYAKHHIRVNALAPGPTLTERVKKFVAGDQRADEKHLLSMGEPDDVAQAALLLASDGSRRITGTIVPVDSVGRPA